MSKYIIDIPKTVRMTEKVGSVHCTYFDGIQCQTIILKSDEIEELNSDYINEHFGDLQDTAYQRGLDDAWEAARKIADMWETMDNDDLLETFGVTAKIGESVIGTLFKKQTANEAMLELEAYEEKQKEEDEIKVGDEVAFHHDDGRPDTVVVVTYIGQDGYIDGMDGRGTQYAHKNPTKWTKTGRHFDIAGILEEMKK